MLGHLENLITHWGWCCSTGCHYVSIMHGLSSRFLESARIDALATFTNPTFIPPFATTDRTAAA